jgi:NAD(P)-dependent dehydrogenase (short-subunit alcohol dehydrogenase family)
MAKTSVDGDRKQPVYADMAGKVALVTGGSSGIGLATARAFALQGARVMITSRGKSAAQQALRTLSKVGEVQWVEADASDAKSVAKMVAAVMKNFGQLDYAFNNAGSGARIGPIAKASEEAWRKTIDGFLTSAFLCMRAELGVMEKSGVIVNNASVDGLRGYPFPGGFAYSAAKHGVVGLTRSAALEHAKTGPRICAVCPGWIDTPPVAAWMQRDMAVAAEIVRQTPRGKIGDPDEVAASVLWLCSAAASFAVGTILPIDGGYMA